MKLMRAAAALTAARSLARRHAPQVHAGIDRAASVAKERVEARHHTRIDQLAGATKRAATGRP